MIKKTFETIAMIFIFCSIFSFKSYSAEIDINKLKKELEQKYGFTIIFESEYTEEEKKQFLINLKKGFSRYPDGLIKEITQYYKKKENGNLDNAIIYRKEPIYSDETIETAGTFGLGTIYIMESYSDAHVEIHEMAHYLHMYLGYDTEEKWRELNRNYAYFQDSRKIYGDINVDWISAYAEKYGCFNSHEDFATMIEAMTERVFLKERFMLYPNSILLDKFNYINELLYKKTKSVTPDNNIWLACVPDKISLWAIDEYEKAKELKLLTYKGLISDSSVFDYFFSSNISRELFCILMGNLIEIETGNSLYDIAKNKGLINKGFYNLEEVNFGNIEKINPDIINFFGKLVEFEGYPFEDYKDDFISYLNILGIIDGTGDGFFNPDQTLTREQAATLIYRVAKFLDKDLTYSEASYIDSNLVSDWAKEAVNFVSSSKIMSSYNNNFNPKSSYTFEQAYVSILRLYNLK